MMIDNCQSISNRVSVAGLSTVTRAMVHQSNDTWRLVISCQYASKIKLEIYQSNTSRTITLYCPTSSTVDYCGAGNFVASVENLTPATGLVFLSVEKEPIETQYQIESDTQTIADNAWHNASPNNGYAPPFCNYVSIYSDRAIKLQMLDLQSNVVWDGTITETQQNILNELRIPATCLLQLSNSTTSVSQNYKLVWFKKT